MNNINGMGEICCQEHQINSSTRFSLATVQFLTNIKLRKIDHFISSIEGHKYNVQYLSKPSCLQDKIS